jgi:hypothetical protein
LEFARYVRNLKIPVVEMYVISQMTTSELALLKEYAEAEGREIATGKVADDFINKDRTSPDNSVERQIAEINREQKIKEFLGR